MSFTKFALYEVGDILDVKGSSQKAKTASLDKLSDFHDFRTDDGYLYVRIRAISSRVNKNNDGWPSVELAGGQDIWDKISAQRESNIGITVEADTKERFGYSTFVGKPIFVDHHNSDPSRARGVIVDAKLHVDDHKTASELDKYYANAPEEHTPPTWVELLLEVDAKSFPKLAKAIIEGSEDEGKGIDGFSMGCDVENTICSICSNVATSPDEYCNHVKLKGASFDTYDDLGKKTSRKAYEDCYGIQFFEISAVFDPADETALTREVISSVQKEAEDTDYPAGSLENRIFEGKGHCPKCNSSLNMTATGQYHCTNCGYIGGSRKEDNEYEDFLKVRPDGIQSKTADGTIPQSELTTAPEQVDTLRDERICPVCGSTIDATKCDVCGFVPPPDSLDNPDLTKAPERRERAEGEEAEATAEEESPVELNTSEGTPTEGESYLRARNSNQTESVTSDMAWEPEITPRLAAVLAEREVSTDEPQEEVLKDETKPTKARSAKQVAAAAKEKTTVSDKKVAADPADASGKADKQVDATGVGGVQDASNEQASKADKQVDAEGKGSTGVEGTEADETQSVTETADDNAGFDTKKNTDDSGPTKTFPKGDKDLDANKVHDNQAFPKDGAKQGTDPVDSVGKADNRVDLEQAADGGQGQTGTDQWTGTDGNGVTKQQPPVTQQVDPNIDSRSSAVLFAAFQLADKEVELGLIDKSSKYQRVAELERKSPETIRELREYADKVRTANLSKPRKTAQRVPSLSNKTASASHESAQEKDSTIDDSALFV